MSAVIELELGAGPTPGTYSVHVLKSLAGGEPSATISLDIDDVLDGLPQIESSILASSVSARRVMSLRESAVQSIGVRLFDAVFTGRIGEVYRASNAVASERGLTPQLTLRLTAPRLAALPWEALYDSEAGRYVSRKEPLVRRVSSPYAGRLAPVTAPLRILGMVSSPRGLEALDVEAEKERLESALAAHLEDGSVELVWLADTSWGGLHGELLREQWHVLHFIGHGGYDDVADEGLIAFVGRDGRADFVSASSLADLLNEASSAPRLVVLNSCQSGSTGTSDLFAGTAATLVHSGINAVVAMQFAVSDYAALAFARSFYIALASGRRIDEAVRSGRIGILGITRDTLEWITPVLYLGGDDTSLLDPSAAIPTRSAVPAVPGPSMTGPVVVGAAASGASMPGPVVVGAAASETAVPEPALPSSVAESPAVKPTAVEPSAVEPTGDEPPQDEPADGPGQVEPAAIEDAEVDPAAIAPAVEPPAAPSSPVERAAFGPAAVEPASAEPTAFGPSPAGVTTPAPTAFGPLTSEPAPAEPEAFGPTPAETLAAVAATSVPTHVESPSGEDATSQPGPAEAVLVDDAASQPTPAPDDTTPEPTPGEASEALPTDAAGAPATAQEALPTDAAGAPAEAQAVEAEAVEPDARAHTAAAPAAAVAFGLATEPAVAEPAVAGPAVAGAAVAGPAPAAAAVGPPEPESTATATEAGTPDPGQSPGGPTTTVPGTPATGESPPPPPAKSRKRTAIIVASVAGAFVVGGLIWAGIAVWGGGTVPDEGLPQPSEQAPTPSATTAPTPVVMAPVAVEVLGGEEWTETSVACEVGDTVLIQAEGFIQLDPNPTSTATPDGLTDPRFLKYNVEGLPDANTAGLIGSLDKGQPFFVGSEFEYDCPAAGALFLGPNDTGLETNTGWWDVTITRTDNPSQ